MRTIKFKFAIFCACVLDMYVLLAESIISHQIVQLLIGERLFMCVCALASGSCSGRSRPSKMERIDPGLPSGGGRIDTS